MLRGTGQAGDNVSEPERLGMITVGMVKEFRQSIAEYLREHPETRIGDTIEIEARTHRGIELVQHVVVYSDILESRE